MYIKTPVSLFNICLLFNNSDQVFFKVLLKQAQQNKTDHAKYINTRGLNSRCFIVGKAPMNYRMFETLLTFAMSYPSMTEDDPTNYKVPKKYKQRKICNVSVTRLTDGQINRDRQTDRLTDRQTEAKIKTWIYKRVQDVHMIGLFAGLLIFTRTSVTIFTWKSRRLIELIQLYYKAYMRVLIVLEI